MKPLRALSTRSLVALALAIAVIAAGGAAIAVARGGGGPTPPPKPLAQAIHDALAAPASEGVAARIEFTNKLFPSGALLGNVGSALMSGASGRLWVTNDGRGRVELQSNAGDAQIVWNTTALTVYDASSSTVYKARLPAEKQPSENKPPPTLTQIAAFLTKLGKRAEVSGAKPSDVAGRPAYTVSIAPKHDGGLLGSAELAWDAVRGVPLRVAIYAQGSSSPVLELAVTDISYGPVPAGDVDIAPPAGAKVVDLGSIAKSKPDSNEPPAHVSGIDAVKAAADFPVVAPDTLVGLPRKDVRLVGSSDSKAALVVYGQGLGALVLVERKSDVTASQQHGDVLSSLPTISLDGVTAHELATQLGTVIQWRRDGVDYILAGSLPPAAAEAAARDLK